MRSRCRVRIDRIKVAADYFPKVALRFLRDFRCEYDYSRKAGKVPGYNRVCRYVNDLTGTQIEGSYDPQAPWLPRATLTLVANDLTGLLRREVDAVLWAAEGVRLLLVEVALDFGAASKVDRSFVHKHLVAGKAWHHRSPRAPGFEYFGSRRSPKFLRCYAKRLLKVENVYRVETELHTTWLRAKKIGTVDDFVRLKDLLPGRELKFVRLDLVALERHLRRHGLPIESNLKRGSSLPDGLQPELARLRRLGLRNTHRLLVGIRANREVQNALTAWARRWSEPAFGTEHDGAE